MSYLISIVAMLWFYDLTRHVSSGSALFVSDEKTSFNHFPLLPKREITLD